MMTKQLGMAFLILLLTTLNGARVTGGDKANDPLPGVRAKLVISVEEYDPSKPSKGIVKCLVINKSKAPVEVLVGYDGKTNQLKGQGEGHRWESTLYSHKRPKIKLKCVQVKPGDEQVVFVLSLDEILFQGVKIDPGKAVVRGGWEWSWFARPIGPASPIHRLREPGFLGQATFWAEVAVGDKKLSSEKVGLKVKPRAVERK